MKKLILTLTALTTFAFGAIHINDDMSNFSHLDQFNNIHKVSSNTKKMIFAFTKSTGHMIKEFLTNKNDDYLTSKNIMYIADVSSMELPKNATNKVLKRKLKEDIALYI